MVLNLFLIGLAIALDPLPLTAFMVVLPSKRGVWKGAAFVVGWQVSLAIVVTVTVLATGNNPPEPSTAPSLASLAVKIAIGVALVAIAIRHRRRMGRPKKPKKPPKWQASVDNMTLWFAFVLAPALQPWGLIGAGAATVMEAKLSSWGSYLALVFFCILASAPTWPWRSTPVVGETHGSAGGLWRPPEETGACTCRSIIGGADRRVW